MYFLEDDFLEFIDVIEEFCGETAVDEINKCIKNNYIMTNSFINPFLKSQEKYKNKPDKFKKEFKEFLLKNNSTIKVNIDEELPLYNELLVGLLIRNPDIRKKLVSKPFLTESSFNMLTTVIPDKIEVKDRFKNLKSLLGFHTVEGITFFGIITDTGNLISYQMVFFDGKEISTYVPKSGNNRKNRTIDSLDIKRDFIKFINNDTLIEVDDFALFNTLSLLRPCVIDNDVLNIINNCLLKITKGEGFLWN